MPTFPCPCPQVRDAGPCLATLLLAASLLSSASPGAAQTLDDQWYVGVGGGASWLRPDTVTSGFELDEETTAGGALFIGRDLDERASVQLQLHALGEAAFESGETVTYTGVDLSALYRLVDSRDHVSRERTFGASLYGRFGLGFMDRDSDIALERVEAEVDFGVGAGVELYLTRNLALRAEGLLHDRDASSAMLSVVARFGNLRTALPSPPPSLPPEPAPSEATPLPAPAPLPLSDRPEPSATTVPVPPAAPESPGRDTSPERTRLADAGPSDGPLAVPPGAGSPRSSPSPETAAEPSAPPPPLPAPRGDTDGDGVPDALDTCLRSAAGFPVRENGCALLDGVLRGLKFLPGTAELAPEAREQLDYLAGLLEEYPRSSIELQAHTDDSGSVRDQSILTRARLRALGTYLVQQRGIRSNRLVLRSFGGTRPLYDNRTEEGREANNRIEVLENTD